MDGGNGWCSCRGAIRAKSATNDGSVISGIRTGHHHTKLVTSHHTPEQGGGKYCSFQLLKSSHKRYRLYIIFIFISQIHKKKWGPFHSCEFFSSLSVCGQLAIGPRSLLSGLHLYCHETSPHSPQPSTAQHSPAQPSTAPHTSFLLNHEHFSPRAQGSMRGAGRRESEKRC